MKLTIAQRTAVISLFSLLFMAGSAAKANAQTPPAAQDQTPDPTREFGPIDQITILPVVDARADRAVNVDLQSMHDRAYQILWEKCYPVSQGQGAATGRRWVVVVTLTGLSGRVPVASASASLYNEQDKNPLWAGNATSRYQSTPGLQGGSASDQMQTAAAGQLADLTTLLLMPGSARNTVIFAALDNLFNDLPSLAPGDGWTPLDLAAYQGRSDRVKALITAGADAKQKDGKHETALLKAVFVARPEKYYTYSPMPANVCLNRQIAGLPGCTAQTEHTRQLAAGAGSVDCVQDLIDAGADVKAKDRDGMTALMEAAMQGNLDCVKALIAAGSDLKAKDKHGRNALALAKSEDVAAALRVAGAMGK